jgi:hypothetical protein
MRDLAKIIQKEYKKREFIDYCPFTIDSWLHICGVKKVCDFTETNLCIVILRLARAFECHEWKVIQHLWHKARSNYFWDDLVGLLTDSAWTSYWQIKLGKWLMDQCRETPSCPFKPLLPETEVEG